MISSPLTSSHRVADASLMLRSDLQRSRIRMGRSDYVVVKDPLSRAYFYFTHSEWSILELLNGQRRLSDLLTECAQRFAPDTISPDALLYFLADAKSKGLLHSPADRRSQTNQRATQPRWYANPLAIRLPGINPNAALENAHFIAKHLTHPALVIAWLVGVTVAAITVLVHFETFSDHVAHAAQRTTTSWWLMVVGVISLTKIVHELAHALTCKLFGGECRELGVMFLIGVPCLYCDVSDAWMIPQRFKRILISAAGILAELAIAAVAVLLWQTLDAGTARDLCVTVIVVCSVNTLIFNGNPLLRYDGYFILTDLVGIPNLGSQSRQLIRDGATNLVWGLTPPTTTAPTPESRSRKSFLVVYGLLSGVYRMAIMIVLASIAHHWLTLRGLGQIANLLACIVATAMVYRIAKPILTPPLATKNAQRKNTLRPAIFACVCVGLFSLVLFVPLPRHIAAPLMVLPTDATPIYVATSGQIVQSIEYESDIQTGDMIAKLDNADATLQLTAQQTRRDELQTRLDGLRKRQVSDPAAVAQIPATVDLLESVTQRCQLLQNTIDRLVITSPRSGRFFPPPAIASKPISSPQSWTGTPLDRANRGALLSTGTLIGTVGDPKRREAILLVDQNEMAALQLGQNVEVLAASQARGGVAGKIIEVSSSPIDVVPPELYAAGLIPPLPVASAASDPSPTYYQVRVNLDPPAASLPVRSTSAARVSLPPQSLWSRLRKTK